MSWVKTILITLWRLTLVFVAMLIAYSASTTLMDQANIAMSEAEAVQAARGLIVVCLFNALVLSFLASRSRWFGWQLVGALWLIYFGVETFMAQIETIYFNQAVQMADVTLLALVGAGAVRAAIIAPAVVLIWGRVRRPPEGAIVQELWPTPWDGRLMAMAVFYLFVYFLFGYFVAWQWPETRQFYTGTAAIKPFGVHFRELFLEEDRFIILFQLLRGVLWTLLAVLIVRLVQLPRWGRALTVALTFVVFFALPVGLFPNPYMPAAVAQSHFVEIVTSMLLFGIVSGWVMAGQRLVPVRETSNGKAQIAH